MPRLRTSIAPVRNSLWLALGLLSACPKDPPAMEPGTTTSGTDTSGSTGTTTSPTTGVTMTGATTDVMTTNAMSTTDAMSTTADLSGDTESSGGSTTDLTMTSTSTTSLDTSTAGSSGSGDSTTGDSTTDVPPVCVQLMQGFVDPPVPSGWELCDGELAHRVEAVACVVPATPATCPPEAEFKNCETNADCIEHPFGSCQGEPQLNACSCAYGCQTDADCQPNYVCRCAGDVLGPFTRCVESTCTDDGDCPGERCQFANAEGTDCPLEVTQGGCTSAMDLCVSDADCGGHHCSPIPGENTWYCGGGVCGRPLLVDDHAVTAPVAARDDWRALLAVPAAPPALHGRLAAHWTAIALAEHASVASFARFILQLLAVGAPPDLVIGAQRALADEVEHARVGFALASLYGGSGVGPGDLAGVHGSGPCDLEAVLAAVIREACVGETLSALEVREAAVRAEDPTLRRALTRIADDEQRHAELGWRFVQWALARADAAQRARAHEMFGDAIASALAAAEMFAAIPGAPDLRPHGVVDAPLRASIWREGVAQLIRPAAQALRAA